MRILQAWAARKFELIVTLEILGEYRRVGARLGRRFPESEAEAGLVVGNHGTV